MIGTCRLCGQQTKLKESHFIPKFVGKWLKKTSITGFFREHNELEKRVQDTAKEYWLCGQCEGLLSNWEREFANRIFYPFADQGHSTASYGPWFAKFCASLSWRTLTFIRHKNPDRDKPDEYYKQLDAAQDHLRKFILGETENLEQYEQHVFHLQEIESTDSNELPTGINRYFLRGMAMDVVGNSTDLYIYTKIPSFIILGVVKAKQLNKLRASRVALKEGKLSPRAYRWPDGFHSYVFEKAEEMILAHQKIPEKDLKKFEDFIADNPEKAANSKQFKALMHDYQRFGAKIFR